MWTETTRANYDRHSLRYASDLTDEEWKFICPHLPARRDRGRPRTTSLREVVNAILYLLRTGCPWRFLPADFPPRSTVQRYFYAWRDNALWPALNRRLVERHRQSQARNATPTAGVIDSQSVATIQVGGPRGLDPFKRIKGRKRHIVTDTDGLLLDVLVHPANVQDVHGAVPLLRSLRQTYPNLAHIFADRVYRGPKLLKKIEDCGPWTIEIVERPTGVKGFALLPRRWVIERTFAWFGRRRRLAKDFEVKQETQTAWLYIASIELIIRRLAKAQE